MWEIKNMTGSMRDKYLFSVELVSSFPSPCLEHESHGCYITSVEISETIRFQLLD